MIDLHCHILPGIDDGPPTLKEALKMAGIAASDGIEKAIATPHLFRGDFVYEDLSLIDTECQKLNRSIKESNIPLEVFPGAEVHISHNLINEIRKNRKHLVLNQSSYMFVEFPVNHVYSRIKRLFSDLKHEEIIPIITHPERNSVFIYNPNLLYELISAGALSQANSGSLNGVYGKDVEEAAFRFLELNLVHFIASDCHNTDTIPPILSEASLKVAESFGEEKAIALVRDNPQAVFYNKSLPFYPDPIKPKKARKTLKIRIPNLFRRKK